MSRGLSRCLYEHALRPDDDEAERERKRITADVLPTLAIFGVVAHVWLLLRFGESDPPAQRGALAGFGLVFYGLLAYMIILRRMPLVTVEIFMAILSGLLIVLDWAMRAVPDNSRAWPYIVLCMDFLLSVNARHWVQVGILAATTLWVSVFYSELAFRWGLLDFHWVQPSEERIEERIGCSDPPCALGAVRATLIGTVTLSVIYVDYFATRGFAQGQRRQLEVVRTAVHVSGRLAALLAAYDTDEARRVVAEEGSALPDSLRVAYEQLLDNLNSYRCYLPDSILYVQQQHQQIDTTPDEDQRGLPAPRVAPGRGRQTADVAICFTDIQSSTELWEAFPQGMYAGLETHNRVMRNAYSACGGYEVKTIGDSFMVAFDTALDAVRFGLSAQQQLLCQQWPEDLLTHPLCRKVVLPSGELLWGGLRVRIGLHSGEARVERNPVTGRSDYFGTTVNIAARLESALRAGGGITVTETVASLVTEQGAFLDNPVLRELGRRQFRGVREPVPVWLVLPQVLAQRVRHVTESFENIMPRRSPAPPTGSSRRISLPQIRSSQCGSDANTSSPLSVSTLPGRADQLTLPGFSEPDSCPLLTITPGPRSLSLKMQSSGTTCAVARLSLTNAAVHMHYRHPRFVATACLAADKTLGLVEGVMSACVTVTWNAVKPCADHVAACRQFLAHSFADECHLGMASGVALSGSVSAGRRSFTTAIGGNIEFASALAEEAEICGDLALAAGAVAEHCEALGLAHWAQLWRAPGSNTVAMSVVLRGDQEEDEHKWALTEGSLEGSQWTGHVAGLFHQACAGAPGSETQFKVLSELRSDQPSQRALGGVISPQQFLADRIEKGLVRTRLMPALWHPPAETELLRSLILPHSVTDLCTVTSISGSRNTGTVFQASPDDSDDQ